MRSNGPATFFTTLVVALLVLLTEAIPHEASAAPPRAFPKKIIIAMPTEPDTLDLNSSKMDGASAPIAENITERLVAVTPDGKLVPGLAVSWKRSPDEKEIDFVLRKGVKFHNGDSFTAKDVQFSHEKRAQELDDLRAYHAVLGELHCCRRLPCQVQIQGSGCDCSSR